MSREIVLYAICYFAVLFSLQGCSGNPSNPEINTGIASKTRKQWNQADAFFRLHGTYSLDNLAMIVGG